MNFRSVKRDPGIIAKKNWTGKNKLARARTSGHHSFPGKLNYAQMTIGARSLRRHHSSEIEDIKISIRSLVYFNVTRAIYNFSFYQMRSEV
jgi:hypothetical protein